MNRKFLEEPKGTNADKNSIKFNAWEISEMINTSRCTSHKYAEEGYDFRLLHIDPASFENFKLSPSCVQEQHDTGGITKIHLQASYLTTLLHLRIIAQL